MVPESAYLASAELYDPETGTSATLFSNGKVLITESYGPGAIAELFQ